jgi:hypothetical protein
MLIAQALGEYGAMAGLIDAVKTIPITIEDYVGQLEPATWAMVGVGAFVVWFIIGRMR